jgi:hypothetical protein
MFRINPQMVSSKERYIIEVFNSEYSLLNTCIFPREIQKNTVPLSQNNWRGSPSKRRGLHIQTYKKYLYILIGKNLLENNNLSPYILYDEANS